MQLTRSRPERPEAEHSAEPAQGRHPRRRGGARRALVLAGRVVLWAALLLLAVRGAVGVAGELAGTESAVDAPATAATAASTFPTAQARAFATRFAHDYLTYDDALPERAERLSVYGLPTSDRQLGWDGNGAQVVRTVLPVEVTVLADDRASVVVAAQVSGPRWLHLSVPVVTDGEGGLAVPELPAFVAPPPEARVAPAGDEPLDGSLGRELTPVLESFFDAYAASRADDLGYYLPVGETLDGLGGVVELDALVEVAVAEGGGDRRTAFALVRWRDAATDARLTQRYDLVLTNDAGRWYVEHLGTGDPEAASHDEGGRR